MKHIERRKEYSGVLKWFKKIIIDNNLKNVCIDDIYIMKLNGPSLEFGKSTMQRKCDKNKHLEIVLLSIKYLKNGKNGGHRNSIIVDHFNKTYERFEPNGHNRKDDIINQVLQTDFRYKFNIGDYKAAIASSKNFIKDFPELKIYVKVGSMSNTGSPDSILNAAYLELMRDSLLERFKANLYGIGIHWDNRDELLQDKKQNNILHTLEKFYQKGLEVGLSGVKTPRNYDNASVNWLIESKFITNERVVQEYDNSLIYGYGLFKSVNKEQSNEKDTKEGVVNTSDLLTQLFSQGFHGFITGASNESQLRDILRGYANLLPLPVRGLGKK